MGNVQKTMVDVGGAPFLERLVAWAARGGVERVVLCAGYGFNAVAEYFKRRMPPPEVVISVEPAPQGTAGAVRFALPLVDRWPILVVNGDSFCPVDLPAFGAFHHARGGGASLVAVPSSGRSDVGFMSVGNDSRVTAFNEKDPAGGGWVSAGIYILSERAVAGDGPGSLEKDVFPGLLQEGVFAMRTALPLWDIGTPERLEACRNELAGG